MVYNHIGRLSQKRGDGMRIDGLGPSIHPIHMPQSNPVHRPMAVQEEQVMSREQVQNLLDMNTYNQTGLAERMVQMISNMAAGMNFNGLG